MAGRGDGVPDDGGADCDGLDGAVRGRAKRGPGVGWSWTLAVVLAGCGGLAGQEADAANEFWPEFDVFVKLNQNTRLFGMYSATRPQSLGTYADGQTGLHLDLFGVRALRQWWAKDNADESRSKSLLVRMGYVFSRPKNNSGSSLEHMAVTEGTARFHLPGELLLSDRNRLELRWVEGAPRHRYRNRLKLERTFQAGRFQLTPYAHGEVFYDLRNREWSRVRYAAGGEWAITKQFVFEAYYLRQNSWGSTPRFVNATGLALQFYLR
jgi:hypothetical protein